MSIGKSFNQFNRIALKGGLHARRCFQCSLYTKELGEGEKLKGGAVSENAFITVG